MKGHLTSEQIITMENGAEEPTKLIHVPMQTFPPTAMVYSVPKKNKEIPELLPEPNGVPSLVMAKVLAQPDMKGRPQRTYFCVKCKEDYFYAHKETQTNSLGDTDKSQKAAIRVHRKVRNQLSSSSTEAEHSP